MRKFSIVFLSAFAALSLSACSDDSGAASGDDDLYEGNGPGGISGSGKDLSWALGISDGVRDSSLPGAVITSIYTVGLDSVGELVDMPSALFYFNYYDQGSSAENDSLIVTVLYSGSSESAAEPYELDEVLPSYTSAAPWIAAGDAALDASFEYDERDLAVLPNYFPLKFPGADNIAAILYWGYGEDDTGATVILDADTNEVLDTYDGTSLLWLTEVLDALFPEA